MRELIGMADAVLGGMRPTQDALWREVQRLQKASDRLCEAHNRGFDLSKDIKRVEKMLASAIRKAIESETA